MKLSSCPLLRCQRAGHLVEMAFAVSGVAAQQIFYTNRADGGVQAGACPFFVLQACKKGYPAAVQTLEQRQRAVNGRIVTIGARGPGVLIVRFKRGVFFG